MGDEDGPDKHLLQNDHFHDDDDGFASSSTEYPEEFELPTIDTSRTEKSQRPYPWRKQQHPEPDPKHRWRRRPRAKPWSWPWIGRMVLLSLPVIITLGLLVSLVSVVAIMRADVDRMDRWQRAIPPFREIFAKVDPARVNNASALAEADVISRFDKYNPAVTSRPEKFPVIGVVFFGRRRFVGLLTCYLRKNLKKNGGYLDKVQFIIHTENEQDLIWLNDVVLHESAYEIIHTGFRSDGKWDWRNVYPKISDEKAMYIKMDDDVVYIHDEAIPRLVHALLDHPEADAVSANTVNSPEGNWMHYHTGAIRPFLPEPAAHALKTKYDVHFRNQSDKPIPWRTSALPTYPLDDYSPPNIFQINDSIPQEDTDYQHRWLPLPNTPQHLARTPIAQTEYAPYGRALKKWPIGAQQHYSLLANLEDGQEAMERYFAFGGGREHLWNMVGERYSINFFAMWGKSIGAIDFGRDDEFWISQRIPEIFDKPFLVQGKALVSHFSFGSQQPSMESTDLLGRYRGYAEEMVCSATR